jgi:diguanylate cyclase (GGDEF)-like protein
MRSPESGLAAISEVMRRTLRGEDARDAIVAGAAHLAGASGAHLLEPEGAGELRITASAGIDLAGLRIPLAEPSATASAFRGGEPVFVPDTAVSPFVSPSLLAISGAGAMIWQPVGEALGLLSLWWPEPVSALSAPLRHAVELLADEAALALAHRAVLAELARRACTDALTGLPNRGAWDERLAHELAGARRSAQPLTVALADLDRFRDYNDAHGRAAGDELLRSFAAAARAALREVDTLGRWGGQELAALLPDCPAGAPAETVLERLRCAVPAGQSCSVGYATWNGRESAHELLRRADRALCAAKQSGRDRVAAA